MALLTWAVLLLAGASCTHAVGNPTDIFEYPSLVQVEFRVGLVWLQQCVGTIITNYHFISAASCFPANVADTSTAIRRARAGTSYRGTGGSVNIIYAVYSHNSYGEKGNDGNIAMVRLESAMTMGPNIQQSPIVGDGVYLPEDLRITFAGWGTTAEGGLIGNDNLYELNLFTKSNEVCAEVYEDREIITENMFCSGLRESGGRDLDSRDEGAPVFYQGVIAGIISAGVSRGDDEYPIISTAIGSYSSWIVETAANM